MHTQLLAPEITNYCEKMTHSDPELLKKLQQETNEKTDMPQMLSGHIEGRLLKMLVQQTQAKHAIEIGTFTGYSALCIAEGLTENGKLITCDINEDYTSIAKKYFAQSPYGEKIQLRLGDALQTLSKISHEIDFAFIDADKERYKDYYEAILPKLRRGGLIVVDNCLWDGKVLHPDKEDKSTLAIAALNEFVARDERVENVLLSVRDGINVIRKI